MGTNNNTNERNTLESQTGLLPLRSGEATTIASANNNDQDDQQRANEPPKPEVVRNYLGGQSEKMSIVPWFCPASVSFPYLFLSSLVKFGIYVHKLFQDSSAVHTYYEEGNTRFMVLSVAALVAPTLLYVVFLLGSRFARSRRGHECAEWFTGMLNGILLIPWQIKGRADVLHFTSQRICARRKPTNEEGEQVETLNRQASVLEFFEEFYAGFLQLVLQLYIFILTLSAVDKAKTDKPLIGETIASVLALIATVKAVKRKDDGILTGFLSMFGWFCFFASRFVAMSLAASVIHHWIGLACAVHVIGVSVWISRVAWQSHQEPTDDEPSPEPLTCRQKTSIFFLVTSMFGLPSLTYWPIMFQMKERKRPFIFILICALENVAAFLLWYFGRRKNDKDHEQLTIPDYACLGVLFVGLVVGSLCITAYVVCKPRYTDQVVMYEMKVQNANSYGIFYDFCDATFKLPKADKIGRNLERVRHAR